MRRYWAYLRYLMMHKWLVLLECAQSGIFWRGLTHDLSRFWPDEFIPFAKNFYNPDGSMRDLDARTQDEVVAFDTAFLRHIHRNPYHWQYWILFYDTGKSIMLDMPEKDLLELIADWRSISRVLDNDLNHWYIANSNKIRMAFNTKTELEQHLGVRL